MRPPQVQRCTWRQMAGSARLVKSTSTGSRRQSIVEMSTYGQSRSVDGSSAAVVLLAGLALGPLRSLDHRLPLPLLRLRHARQVADDNAHRIAVAGQFCCLVLQPLLCGGFLDAAKGLAEGRGDGAHHRGCRRVGRRILDDALQVGLGDGFTGLRVDGPVCEALIGVAFVEGFLDELGERACSRGFGRAGVWGGGRSRHVLVLSWHFSTDCLYVWGMASKK